VSKHRGASPSIGSSCIPSSKYGLANKLLRHFSYASDDVGECCSTRMSIVFPIYSSILSIHYDHDSFFFFSGCLIKSFSPQVLKSMVCKYQVVMSEAWSSSSTCIQCKTNRAEIFQAIGEFCSDCWQKMTEPAV
jgi:hypothetical protein